VKTSLNSTGPQFNKQIQQTNSTGKFNRQIREGLARLQTATTLKAKAARALRIGSRNLASLLKTPGRPPPKPLFCKTREKALKMHWKHSNVS